MIGVYVFEIQIRYNLIIKEIKKTFEFIAYDRVYLILRIGLLFLELQFKMNIILKLKANLFLKI